MSRNGKELVKVDYRQTNLIRGKSIPVEGFVLFDPSNFWARVESQSWLPQPTKGMPTKSVIRVAYSDTPLGAVRPYTRVEQFVQYNPNHPAGADTNVFEVEVFKLPDLDDEVFSLSGYGLPEPQGVTWKNPTPRYVWLLAAGGVCVALAVLFRWLARRPPPPRTLRRCRHEPLGFATPPAPRHRVRRGWRLLVVEVLRTTFRSRPEIFDRGVGTRPRPPFGRPTDITFRITNSGARPIRVVGMAEFCTPNCCFYSKHRSHVSIPPRETVDYACEVKPTTPGPFESPMTLYLDSDGIREVKLTIRGTIIATEGPKDEPSNP